jgi:arabinan endo-1,5-alpha-L-arabinosidase
MYKLSYYVIMKNILLSTGFALFLCVCSCGKTSFVPSPSPNPWKDDYRSVSKMEDYRQWGTYNVHDPACKKFGDYYYMYSTDAIFMENRREIREKEIPTGYIQVRRSKDLVNWEFVGWAFPEIPEEAVKWVRNNSGGRGATNIWAPYIIQHNDKYRLYYCVSAFGKKTSYIGLAESPSPEGPWELKGCVVKTDNESVMNAIDPSVIIDVENGKWWMHYGSFFGGVFCVQLNPETGLPVKEGDQGHLTARRANYKKDNLEGPEVVYHPGLKKYFLFMSYDPLMTTYNVRVGRSDVPEGPFFDYNGLNLKDTVNNFPILTAPYRFDNHPGWAGTAHCGVWGEEDGRFFMFHQGRLSPYNAMMVLHTRQVFFTPEGWPVVSPERYAGSKPHRFEKEDLAGEWEMIRILEPRHERGLEAGQVLQGEGELTRDEWNISFHTTLTKEGLLENGLGQWKFTDDDQILSLIIGEEAINNLIVFAGHDWENEQETVLFTGLDKAGRSFWGKRIK